METRSIENTITIDQLDGKESFLDTDLFYTRSANGEDTKTTTAQVKAYVRPENASSESGGLLTAEAQQIAGEKEFIDGIKTSTLEASGATTLKGGATITGDLTVSGDLIVSGEEKKIQVATLNVKDNMIVTREGATNALAAGEHSGIKAIKYDGENNGILAFDKDGIARVGDEGDLQPLATRTENPANGSLAVWNESNKRYEPIEAGNEGDLLESKGEGVAPEFTSHPKVSIKSVTQTKVATESEGENIVTCELTNNVKSNFVIRNGKDTAVYSGFGACTTPANEAIKQVYVSGYAELIEGMKVQILFVDACSVENPQLNINNLGAAPIKVIQHGQIVNIPIHSGYWDFNTSGTATDRVWQENTLLEMVYTSGYWLVMGNPLVCSAVNDNNGYSVYADGKIKQRIFTFQLDASSSSAVKVTQKLFVHYSLGYTIARTNSCVSTAVQSPVRSRSIYEESTDKKTKTLFNYYSDKSYYGDYFFVEGY